MTTNSSNTSIKYPTFSVNKKTSLQYCVGVVEVGRKLLPIGEEDATYDDESTPAPPARKANPR